MVIIIYSYLLLPSSAPHHETKERPTRRLARGLLSRDRLTNWTGGLRGPSGRRRFALQHTKYKRQKTYTKYTYTKYIDIYKIQTNIYNK